MTENNIKEALSESFIHLIASYGGYKVTKFYPDDGSVDLTVTYSKPIKINQETKYIDSGEIIHIQLKSTEEQHIRKNRYGIEYALKVDNYNKLVIMRKKPYIPCFLVLLVLPSAKEEWLTVMSNHVKLKKHAFWYIPDVNDELSKLNGKSRIYIPMSTINKFDNQTFKYLFDNYLVR